MRLEVRLNLAGSAGDKTGISMYSASSMGEEANMSSGGENWLSRYASGGGRKSISGMETDELVKE